MFRSVNGRDYMTKDPVTFTPDTNIFIAIHELLAHKISGATVIDKDNNVVGVISEKDCLKAIVDGSYHGQVNGYVGDYMKTNVQAVSPDMNIVDIATLLISSNRRRLPVVENGKFVGQFSVRSILKAIKDFDVPEDPSEIE